MARKRKRSPKRAKARKTRLPMYDYLSDNDVAYSVDGENGVDDVGDVNDIMELADIDDIDEFTDATKALPSKGEFVNLLIAGGGAGAAFVLADWGADKLKGMIPIENEKIKDVVFALVKIGVGAVGGKLIYSKVHKDLGSGFGVGLVASAIYDLVSPYLKGGATSSYGQEEEEVLLGDDEEYEPMGQVDVEERRLLGQVDVEESKKLAGEVGQEEEYDIYGYARQEVGYADY